MWTTQMRQEDRYGLGTWEDKSVIYEVRERMYGQYVMFRASMEIPDLNPKYADGDGRLCVFSVDISKGFPKMIEIIREQIEKYGWEVIKRGR